MKLKAKSIEWAIQSIVELGDTDLFPIPREFSIVSSDLCSSVERLAKLDLSTYSPGPNRRFIVPKDDMSYRAATQLDPIDSIIFTAIMHQYGHLIESRRRPVEEKTVFSYRFCPSANGELYDSRDSWNSFWNECINQSKTSGVVLVTDISDFYNQIYHHTIENQLLESGLPNQITKWIMRLLGSASAKISRGVPVGPHPAHLLAEMSMIPIDNSLKARGLHFCRFVDDIILFGNNTAETRTALYHLADILDKQQRLQLQKSKTLVLDRIPFNEYCRSMIEDRPINDLEKRILTLIRKYSKGNPYGTVFLNELTEEELRSISPEIIEKIINDYLSCSTPDFIHLRWFIRRLTQTRHPAAVGYLLYNLERLMPALADICHYFASVAFLPGQNLPLVGERLLELLENQVIQSNEYFQLSLLSMFNRIIDLNNTPAVLGMYQSSSNDLKREILLTAAACGESDWLRERKEEYSAMSPWVKRAFLCTTDKLPMEERKFFLRHVKNDDVLDNIVSKWSMKNT